MGGCELYVGVVEFGCLCGVAVVGESGGVGGDLDGGAEGFEGEGWEGIDGGG